MPLYSLCYRHNNSIFVVIKQAPSLVHARLRAALAGDDEGEFTEGHDGPGKWKGEKALIGRRLTKAEAKKLLANLGVSQRISNDQRLPGTAQRHWIEVVFSAPSPIVCVAVFDLACFAAQIVERSSGGLITVIALSIPACRIIARRVLVMLITVCDVRWPLCQPTAVYF